MVVVLGFFRVLEVKQVEVSSRLRVEDQVGCSSYFINAIFDIDGVDVLSDDDVVLTCSRANC
jgi:hypothetical protein